MKKAKKKKAEKKIRFCLVRCPFCGRANGAQVELTKKSTTIKKTFTDYCLWCRRKFPANLDLIGDADDWLDKRVDYINQLKGEMAAMDSDLGLEIEHGKITCKSD
jgi:hypothetical protein